MTEIKEGEPLNAGSETSCTHEKGEALREAYRKHAQELLALEDAQWKLTFVLLGILGAGASFIAGMKQPLSLGVTCALSILVMAIVGIGCVSTSFRSRARRGTRQLVVNCEEALGYYELGRYIPNQTLYPPEFKDFPKVGDWLGYVNWLVVAAGVGFVGVIWSMWLGW